VRRDWAEGSDGWCGARKERREGLEDAMKKHKKNPVNGNGNIRKAREKKEDKERVFRSLPSFLFLYITSSL